MEWTEHVLNTFTHGIFLLCFYDCGKTGGEDGRQLETREFNYAMLLLHNIYFIV